MAFLEWSDDLLLGIAVIDEQHKRLYELVNHLAETAGQSADSREVDAAFGALNGYTLEHFHLEEELFRKYGYREAAEHVKGHRDFEERIAALQAAFISGEPKAPENLLEFLKSWWRGHIKKMDTGYASFLRARGTIP